MNPNAKKETPANIEELKHMANTKSSWRLRLKAVQILKDYDCQQSKDILCRLAIHDLVFTVKEEAFRAAQGLGYSYAGKPIYLGRKPKGHLIKNINKRLAVIRNSLPEEFSMDEFKVEFQKRYPVEYDTYEGDKGKKFEEWIQNVLSALPKRPNKQKVKLMKKEFWFEFWDAWAAFHNKYDLFPEKIKCSHSSISSMRIIRFKNPEAIPLIIPDTKEEALKRICKLCQLQEAEIAEIGTMPYLEYELSDLSDEHTLKFSLQ